MAKTKAPEWAKRLPPWARYNEKTGKVEVSNAEVYPLYLKELGFDGETQSELECARKCMDKDLLKITGPGLALRIIGTAEKKYRLKDYPSGDPLNYRAEYGRICKAREAKGTRH